MTGRPKTGRNIVVTEAEYDLYRDLTDKAREAPFGPARDALLAEANAVWNRAVARNRIERDVRIERNRALLKRSTARRVAREVAAMLAFVTLAGAAAWTVLAALAAWLG